MNIEQLCFVIGILLSCALKEIEAQANRPPRFSVGGDMAHFSIPENVDVGSTIYKLRGTDPEGGSVYFSISGEYFSVNKYTGDVTLIKELDRELNNSVEVIISITDEPKYDAEANTISIRREIPIIDVNDNQPVFTSSQYSLSVLETTEVGTIVYTNITISDRDSGVNSIVNLFCVQSPACQIFSASLQILSEGFYKGIITLVKPLNYEIQSSHTLWLKAIDSNSKHPLSATAKVIIDVEDVQDQPPIFLNTPYSILVPENTQPYKIVINVEAQDGDVNNRRSIFFTLEEDTLDYFSVQNHGSGNASLVTTDKRIDREDPIIVQMGGIYTFYVKATEMINDHIPGDETRELITIVITDENDQLPKFNKAVFHVNVSEDISVGTPLPGLGLIASDDDIGENARFSLSLRSSNPEFSDCFSVEPMEVVRRSPVTIRVVNNSNLDYESGIRDIKLYVIAFYYGSQDEPIEAAVAEIILNIVDVNDNQPEFSESNFIVDVLENTNRGTIIANITAIDRDSGLFSRILYSVGGFGMEKFDTDPRKGGLILVGKLDYEQQISYSLTLEAKDGGNRTTTANIVVNVVDVNDNAPIFEQPEYRRNVREGSVVLQPQFFVKATDIDGRGNNNITYTIVSSNSEAIGVDRYTGELKLLTPASSQYMVRGQYELKIQANDSGTPSLSSIAQVFIRVGVPGNQKPIFKGTPYNITIPETLAPNSLITTVRATDPDGLDETLEYKIAADADNFYIKSRSGMIYLAESADLSVDSSSPRRHNFKVLAIDNGMPFRETAQATVTINIIDVNDKPPTFDKNENYVAYLLDKTVIGSVVMKVKADDPDENADIRYKLLKPFQVSDKRGFLLKQESNDYNELFSINETNGEISLQHSLQNLSVHVITVKIEARDRNAAKNIESQVDTAEVTFFIEAVDDLKPVFLNSGWMRSHPIITYSMPEEMPIGSNVNTILAQDQVTMSPITKFRVKSLPRQLAMDPIGNIVVTERIDYETIPSKVEMSNMMDRLIGAIKELINLTIKKLARCLVRRVHPRENIKRLWRTIFCIFVCFNFRRKLISCAIHFLNSLVITSEYEDDEELSFIVEAISDDNRRTTETNVTVQVIDVNDHTPQFLEKYYQVSVEENSKRGTLVLVVKATDGDLSTSPLGYGNISYHLTGEHAFLFEINSTTGEIKVGRSNIDREKQPALNLVAVAMDTPLGGKDTRKSEVPIQVDVLDVNDNAPGFKEKEYLVVILENSEIGSSVINVSAFDPDIGPAGVVKYDIVNEFDGFGLFKINSESGEITVQKSLTGRGRNHPYLLTVRAEDNGNPVLFNDIQVNVLIGDVVANDGIPVFIHPSDNEVAYISEDAPVGSPVFHVIGVDPDDPLTPEGQIQYFFLKSSPDVDAFNIDSKTGLITTRIKLNRELKSNYSLILEIKDGGMIPQQMTKIFEIRINDTDDNLPIFKRAVDEKPLQIHVKEEVPIGTILGSIEAIDLDEKRNAEIGYLITEGNEDNLFAITENNNSALIESSARIDREKISHVLLTLKCFKKREKPRMLFKKYNKTDFSERQVYIKILDVDDNSPEFIEKNITVGVRFNAPIDFLLLTVIAEDADAEAEPIFYRIVNFSFLYLHTKTETNSPDLPFVLNEHTGELRTNSSLRKFADGYFSLEVAAASGMSTNESITIVKVFVVRERGLLRFVFSKTPSEVKEYISQFKSELENALTLPSVQLNVYEMQFHSKSDGGYDFSRTSTCFQIIMDNNYDTKEAETIFTDENNDQLKYVYQKYGVEAVQRCGNPPNKVNLTWVQISLLSIAMFIGVTSVISSCILCCSYSRFYEILERVLITYLDEATANGTFQKLSFVLSKSQSTVF